MGQRRGFDATVAALLAVTVALAALLAFATVAAPSTTRTVVQSVIQNLTAIQTVTQKLTSVRVTNQTVVQVMNQTVTVTPGTSTVTVLQAEPCFGQLVWKVNSTSVPVLLMRPGSTAYVCVTFSTAWQGNASVYSGMFGSESGFNYVPFGLTVGKWNCTEGGCSNDFYNGPYSDCDRSLNGCYNSFVTNMSPGSVPVNSATQYVDVLYTITALSNSTGFYDQSAPYDYCEGMPLAVGYTASQVNASDFNVQAGSCPFEYFQPYEVTAVGMNSTTIKG